MGIRASDCCACGDALNPIHGPATTQTRPRPAQPHRRRRGRQRSQGPRGARRGGAAGRRSRDVHRAVSRRLSGRGSGPQARLSGCLPRCLRAARPRDRRWRSRHAHRTAVAGRGRGLQRLCAARRRHHHGAVQGRSAQLRRLRRKAHLRAGAAAGAGEFPRHPHRHSDLRGHLDRRRRRMPRRDRRRDPAGAERFALLARQDGGALQHRGRARHGNRPAARLPQRDRRPGRAGLRRRFLRAERRLRARGADARLSGDRGADHVGEGRGRLGVHRRRRWRWSKRAKRRITPPASLAFATMWRRTGFPASCWASRAASIRRSAPPWRSMRSGRIGCIA